MRYFSHLDLAFRAMVTDNHLARARAEEEPYHNGGYGLENVIEPNNFFGLAMNAAEDAHGMIDWFELPGMPVPETSSPERVVSRDEEADDEDDVWDDVPCVIGAVGMSEDTVVLVCQDNGLAGDSPAFDRVAERTGNIGNVSVLYWQLGQEGAGSKPATVTVRVRVAPEGTVLIRHHREESLGMDTYAARCDAILRMMRAIKLRERLRDINAPPIILTQNEELVNARRQEAAALFNNMLPPGDMDADDYPERLVLFLVQFGMTDATVLDLLADDRIPDGVAATYEWETQAVLTPDGELRVIHDVVGSAAIVPTFPAAPSSDAERAAYHAEIRAAMEAAQQLIREDITVAARIGREYGLTVEVPLPLP